MFRDAAVDAMNAERLELIEPTRRLRDDFLGMARECAAEGDDQQKAVFQPAIDDFDAWLKTVRQAARGVLLAGEFYVQATYWLVRDRRAVVATCHLRYCPAGGTIDDRGDLGYATRPSQRGKGYATLACRLTLQRARQMGLRRLRVVCQADNEPSRRVIVHNGGRLEERFVSPQTGRTKERYCIDL